ncbi:hypothetical protein [uncultured Jannaschia sp.]|uniref:hypothetical protein n=1 Tax=uncultured Jannaschia sp. TaxID=293347 RepID=UPI00261C533F|nr:hypothetical protein [uncultured Jannaschia sp.]
MSRYWVAFYRGRGTLADKIVRAATRSPFSHCEMIRQDTRPARGDTVTCLSASARDGGVRIKEITLEDGKWDIYAVPWARPDAWDRALAEEGRPYELWSMVLSQLFNFRRHSRDRWYCSELIAYALGLSMPHAKSPGDLMRAIHDHVVTWNASQVVARPPRQGIIDDEDEMGAMG